MCIRDRAPSPAAIRIPCAIRDLQRALGGRKQPYISPSKASSGGFGLSLIHISEPTRLALI
eukprot:6862709-Alexandrium_andersonii.AAC.1